jgi:ABC-2 type transport system permease protein
LVTYALTGVGYALASLAVVAAIALPWLSSRHLEVSLAGNGLPRTFVGVIADVAIFALVGVGVGALLRNQVAAVVSLLIYRFVAEPVVTGIPALKDWSIYPPGSASNALTQVSLSTQKFLEGWQAGLVLAGYGIVFAVAGTFLSVRRDVT